jgi:hypothetical protein
MRLPTPEDLSPNLPRQTAELDCNQSLRNLKSKLSAAYKIVRENNRKSHESNKRKYDRKAKVRKFQVNDLVYLFCPARKPGVAHKFRKPWSGPFRIVERISDLNYRTESKKRMQNVVHVNRLKPGMNPEDFRLQKEPNTRRRVTFGKVTIIPDERKQEYSRNTLIPVSPTKVVEPQAENLIRSPPVVRMAEPRVQTHQC